MPNKKKITGFVLLILGLILFVMNVKGSSVLKNILCTEGIILAISGSILTVASYKNKFEINNNSINKLAFVGLLLGTFGVLAFWFPWLGFALAGVGLILSVVCFIMALRFKNITTLIIISLFISLTGVNISGFFTFKTMTYANAFSLKYKEVKKMKQENIKK